MLTNRPKNERTVGTYVAIGQQDCESKNAEDHHIAHNEAVSPIKADVDFVKGAYIIAHEPRVNEICTCQISSDASSDICPCFVEGFRKDFF
jgi:hypothetical protein